MRSLGSVAAVIAAIREDGAGEIEAIERDTQHALERIAAEDAAGRGSMPDTTATLTLARERVRTRLAQEDWEDARQALADREEWIARAVELGERRVRDREDAGVVRERLAALAREGMERMPPGPVEIVVPAADRGLLDDAWSAALASADPVHPVRLTTDAIDCGCVVRTGGGRSMFDNTYAARAERLQSVWRAALADIYERATDVIGAAPGSRTEV